LKSLYFYSEKKLSCRRSLITIFKPTVPSYRRRSTIISFYLAERSWFASVLRLNNDDHTTSSVALRRAVTPITV